MEANLTARTNATSDNANTVKQRPISQPEVVSASIPAAQPDNITTTVSLADLAAVFDASSSVDVTVGRTRIVPDMAVDLPRSTAYEEVDVTDAVLNQYVANVNNALAPSFFRLNVGVHEATNRIIVRVVDTKTEEVLRELPPESRLDTLAKMQEFIGILFDGQS